MNDELKAAIRKRDQKKRVKKMSQELRVEKLFLKINRESPAAMAERLEREREAAYQAVPLEVKQKFMDLFRSGKMNLGQAAHECGIDPMIGAQVLIRNVASYEFWPEKVTK